MAGDAQIVSVYARALVEAAGAKAPDVDASLQALQQAFDADPSLWESVTSPDIDSRQRKALLDKVVAGDDLVRNFLRVLVDKGRLELLPDLVPAVRELVVVQQDQLDVDVTTAVELAPNLRTRLEERLAETTGRQVRLHTSVDPDIIGGLVLRYGDTLIDNSVRGRLEQLRLALKRR